jgi:hypothetical protein
MAERKLRHVRQSNRSSGCGPACLAILGRTTQSVAIRAIWGKDKKNDLLTDWPEIKRGLKELGLSYGDRKRGVASLGTLTGVSIVCVQVADEFWHWIVNDARFGLVYDPQVGAPLNIEDYILAYPHNQMQSFREVWVEN